MFIGEYQHTIDPKRRVAIPVKFRETLKRKAIITKGLDSCLFVYPVPIWQKIAEKLSQLPLGEKKMRQFVRLMLAGATETEIDKQGRILIPNYLSDFANLNKKEVVLIGLYDHFEVWNQTFWEKSKIQAEKEKDLVAEELGKMGIF